MVPIIFEQLELYDENVKLICVKPIDGALNITTCTKGDMDWNGETTAADAILVLKIAVEKNIPDEYQSCAADVNGDKEINSADTILVLKSVVRKTTIFLLEHNHGIVDSTINIIGRNFGNSQDGSAIYFGDIQAAAISWMDCEILTTVPSGIPTGAVDVTIVNGKGITSNTCEFTVGQENLRLRDLNPRFRLKENPKIISIPTGIIAEPCEKITIPVDIDNAAGIAGMDLILAFVPSILTPVEAECTDLTDGFFLVSGYAEDGLLRVSGARDTGILSGSGAIINLIFEVSSNVRESISTGITIEDIRLFDEKAEPIEILGHSYGEILINREDSKSSTPKRTNKTIYNTYWKQLSLYGYYPSYFYNFSQVSYWTNLWTHLFGVNYYYSNNGFSYILNQGYPWMQGYYDYYTYS